MKEIFNNPAISEEYKMWLWNYINPPIRLYSQHTVFCKECKMPGSIDYIEDEKPKLYQWHDKSCTMRNNGGH